MVVSVEPNATRAGVEMLEKGGNAVDAAVAVGYALAVTHPSAGNLGGGGFMLVRPHGGPSIAIDFREKAPLGLTRQKFDAMIAGGAVGPAAVGVPGTVAGLDLAHARFGRLPRADVMAPAIRLARDGHRLGPRQAKTLTWSWRALAKDPAARAIFGNGRKPKGEGALLRQPDLAGTLERIAKDGDAGFYRGETARRLVAALTPAGMVGAADLEGYAAVVREPLRFRYRELDLDVAPPPSAGGVALAETLTMLERRAAYRLPDRSAAELHLFLEVSKRAHADRRLTVGDPDASTDRERRLRLQRWLDPDALLAAHPIDPAHATPASQLDPRFADASRELEHTTHFAVVDRDGMAVSCTTTLSAGFGAKFVAAGTGVVLNDSLAAFGTTGENQPAPGRRMTSSMAPTLVAKDGALELVLGSPGGDTIPSTVAQVFRNLVDHSLTLDDAVDAPRLHHGFVPDEVRYEKARPPPQATLEALRALGHRFSKKRIPMGHANSILVADGVAFGYVDPREGGLAAGP